MSALAPRSERLTANDSEWIEFPDRFEISPASVWAPDYEEELNLQRKPAEERRQVTADRVEELNIKEVSRRVRILDETQVLPGEASFATVRLNQEIENTDVKLGEQLTTDKVESLANESNTRTAGLDESLVLPGEASFATVLLYEPLGTRAYSPITEFLARTNLNWKQLKLATLLLVSVLAVTAGILLETATEGLFTAHPPVTTASQTSSEKTQSAITQRDALTSSKLSDSVVSGPDTAIQKNAPTSSTPVKEVTIREATEKGRDTLSHNGISESLRKPPSNDTSSVKPKVTPPQNAKSVSSRGGSSGDANRRASTAPKKLRASVKEPVVVEKRTTSEPSGVNTFHSETAVRKRESPSATHIPAEKAGGEAKVNHVTGEGQRPRRVTPQPDP